MSSFLEVAVQVAFDMECRDSVIHASGVSRPCLVTSHHGTKVRTLHRSSSILISSLALPSFVPRSRRRDITPDPQDGYMSGQKRDERSQARCESTASRMRSQQLTRCGSDKPSSTSLEYSSTQLRRIFCGRGALPPHPTSRTSSGIGSLRPIHPGPPPSSTTLGK